MSSQNYEQRKMIDITLPLHNNMEKPSPFFKGFKLKWDLRIEKGDHRNRSSFSMETHLGTHVDAPLHFISEGKNMNQMDINRLIGKAQVIEVPFPETVSDHFLSSIIEKEEIILFKFGPERLSRDYPYFSKEGVDYLIEKKIKVVGTDNFNIDSKTTEWNIHHLMLGNEIIVVEGLYLDEVDPGLYDFICLPLSIKDGEGAPARAVLFK